MDLGSCSYFGKVDFLKVLFRSLLFCHMKMVMSQKMANKTRKIITKNFTFFDPFLEKLSKP